MIRPDEFRQALSFIYCNILKCLSVITVSQIIERGCNDVCINHAQKFG